MSLDHGILALVYGALAAGGLRAFAHDRRFPAGRIYGRVWLWLAIVVGVAALQALTGVLSGLTDALRIEAKSDGWYSERRPFQAAVIAVVLLGSFGALLGALIWIRPAWRRYALAIVAVVYNLSFTVIQAISLHQVDGLMHQQVGPLPVAAWCHTIGVGLAAAALFIWYRRAFARRNAPSGRSV